MDDVQVVKVAAEKSVFVASNILPTVWMIVLSLLGGGVSFYQKYKAGEARAFNIMELIGELFVSTFVGFVTYAICKGFEVGEYFTVAGVAISSHMGARAIAIAEKIIEAKIKAATGVHDEAH